MKIESLVKIASPQTVLDIYPDGAECAAFFKDDRKVISVSRIRTGKFDESLGLAEKLRRHMANDGLSATAESVNVIPFGCEYHVKRQWKFSGDIAELTDDISADNGGSINDLFLENVEFCGKAVKAAILFAGETQMQEFVPAGVIYDGEKLPVLLKVTFDDGSAAEVYSGDDFWRHQCASAVAGASARHIISCDDEGVRWERHVLIVPEDVVVEKRPWRFKTMFAVSGRNEQMICGAAIDFAGCFAAPAKHREFRNFIRQQQPESCAALNASGTFFCTDGSHVARPGKEVLHGMFGELFDEYIWANSAMARKGGCCVVKAGITGADDSVILKAMSQVPGELSFPDMEDFE